MKSFKSLYKGLALGLSLSLLGLGSTYCGGSSGGGSGGGNGTKNHAPIVTIQKPETDYTKYYSKDSIDLYAIASDPDKDTIISSGWDLGNLVDNISNLIGTFKIPNCSLAETYPLTAYAEDEHNAIGENDRYISIENKQPIINHICTDGNKGVADPFNASLSSDPDGDGLECIKSCSWNWGDGTQDYTETPTTAPDVDGFNCKTTHTYSTSGWKTVTLTIVDNNKAQEQLPCDVYISP